MVNRLLFMYDKIQILCTFQNIYSTIKYSTFRSYIEDKSQSKDVGLFTLVVSRLYFVKVVGVYKGRKRHKLNEEVRDRQLLVVG